MTMSLLLITLVCPVKAFNEDLLLYLSFDNDVGAVAKDLTGRTKGGTIIGGAEWVAGNTGKGSALELDGESGYVEIELTPEMIEAERNSFTVELWLKTEAEGPEVDEEGAVVDFLGLLIFGGNGPEGHSKGHWSMYLFDGHKFRFCVANVNTPTGNTGPGVITDEPKINDGEWHHIAAVRDEDAKEIRAYIDGELVGREDDVTRSLNSRPEDVDKIRDKIWLGIHRDSFLPGIIDEVRFWGKALSEADVGRMMTFAVAPLGKLTATWGNIKARQMGNLGFEQEMAKVKFK